MGACPSIVSCLIRIVNRDHQWLLRSCSFAMQALSDAHAFLFEERQRLLTLQAENDELRLQEIEDRKRIQQLLGQGGKNMQQGSNMAHYSVDALLLKVESLQAQLNEQVCMQPDMPDKALTQLKPLTAAAALRPSHIRHHHAAHQAGHDPVCCAVTLQPC